MSRDAGNRAKAASDTAIATSKDYGGKSDALFGRLSDMYGSMYSNPQGMTQQELSDARTAANQGAGGAVAGAVGQGNLEAARTGNTGAYGYALADAARKGIASSTDAGLKIQNLNTGLKEAQREQGIAGLQGLQTGAMGAQLGAMGNNVNAINAETNASPGWMQNFIGILNAIKGSGGTTSGGESFTL